MRRDLILLLASTIASAITLPALASEVSRLNDAIVRHVPKLQPIVSLPRNKERDTVIRTSALDSMHTAIVEEKAEETFSADDEMEEHNGGIPHAELANEHQSEQVESDASSEVKRGRVSGGGHRLKRGRVGGSGHRAKRGRVGGSGHRARRGRVGGSGHRVRRGRVGGSGHKSKKDIMDRALNLLDEA